MHDDSDPFHSDMPKMETINPPLIWSSARVVCQMPRSSHIFERSSSQYLSEQQTCAQRIFWPKCTSTHYLATRAICSGSLNLRVLGKKQATYPTIWTWKTNGNAEVVQIRNEVAVHATSPITLVEKTRVDYRESFLFLNIESDERVCILARRNRMTL